MAPIPLTLRERAEMECILFFGILAWMVVRFWRFWAFLAVILFLLA